MKKAQASLEYFIIFAVIAGLTLLSVSTFLNRTRTSSQDLYSKAVGRILNSQALTPPPTPTSTPPPPVNGIVLSWNVNHVVEEFQPNETKTFIVRVPQNARGFQVSFQTMGVYVKSSFKMPLKPDGTPYITSTGQTEWKSDMWIGNEGSVPINVFTGSLILDPYIYPGDFVLTLTADAQGGWGWMATSIYY